MSEEPNKIGDKLVRNEKGQFVDGHPDLGAGRPPGRFSITSKMIKRLEENPEETETILKWLVENRKDLIWNKIDSDPPKDINIGGQEENPVRVVIIEKPNEAVPPTV